MSLISPGAGRAYAIGASVIQTCQALLTKDQNAFQVVEGLSAAFRAAGVDPEREMPASEAATLNSDFDMDQIVTFSAGWDHWDDALACIGGGHSLPPLDRQHFSGVHPGYRDYFKGIEGLAEKNTGVVSGLGSVIPSLGKRLLDFGCGPGVYTRRLVDSGLAKEATGLDFAPVVDTLSPHPGIDWTSATVDQLLASGSRPYDAVWFGNVLHHYPKDEATNLLREVAPLLLAPSYVVLHEYPLVFAGRRPLYAAILGLHFWLTSPGGRTYTESELSGMVLEAFGSSRLVASIEFRTSALFVYRVKEG